MKNYPFAKRPTGWQNQKRRSDTTTLSEWLRDAATRLVKSNPDEPASSLRALMAFVLGRPGHYALTHPNQELSHEHESRLDGLLARLISGEPLAYLIGKQEFYRLDFAVTPDVLIPRPETEMLVNHALEFLKTRTAPVLAADVGTGCGCVAISIAYHLPGVQIFASDRSYSAIRIAQENAKQYHLNQSIHFLVADLLSACAARLDCICANLPYIPTDRLATLPVGQHEPLMALDGGADGFSLIQRLLLQCSQRLKPGGAILLEIDHTHPHHIQHAVGEWFPTSSVKIEKDLAGLNRLAIIVTG